jgi:hypothetical protein
MWWCWQKGFGCAGISFFETWHGTMERANEKRRGDEFVKGG